MTKLLKFSVVALLLYAIFTQQESEAANLPNPKLDAIATQVAGKPVTVHCEWSHEEWRNIIAANFVPGTVPDLVGGFTRLSANIVYVSPRICFGLFDAANYGWREAGYAPFSLALMVLVHEAVHQRGITDEAVTECNAVKLTPELMVQHFGVQKRIFEKRIVIVNRKPVVRRVQVANPEFAKLVGWVQRWYRSKPANYQGGTC